jgi:transcription antitermination factor NusG
LTRLQANHLASIRRIGRQRPSQSRSRSKQNLDFKRGTGVELSASYSPRVRLWTFQRRMPILKRENDLWPNNLLDEDCEASRQPWWGMYTLPRFEKKLMRQLEELGIAFYGPTISRRYRSPGGRLRTSYEPLFPNYVFVCGDEYQRYNAVSTGSVSRWLPVPQPEELITDLRQIHRLILTDADLAPETRLEPGDRVRVKNGVFKGFEGTVLRRENEVRLLISVRYMGRGASVALDDCQLESLEV